MTTPSKTPFATRRFVPWAASPFLILFMLLLPVVIDQWTIGRVCGVAGVWLFCGLLLAGFWLPPRWGYWAFRAFGGLVFVAFAAYVVDQFVFGDQPIRFFGSKSEMSPRNALLGLIVLGLPGLWYALFHRDGALSLVEKYVFSKHPRKMALLDELLPGIRRGVLDQIRSEFGVQPPDLLLYTPDRSMIWFGEVKGPGDKVRDAQRRSHEAIEQRLGMQVEMIGGTSRERLHLDDHTTAGTATDSFASVSTLGHAGLPDHIDDKQQVIRCVGVLRT